MFAKTPRQRITSSLELFQPRLTRIAAAATAGAYAHRVAAHAMRAPCPTSRRSPTTRRRRRGRRRSARSRPFSPGQREQARVGQARLRPRRRSRLSGASSRSPASNASRSAAIRVASSSRDRSAAARRGAEAGDARRRSPSRPARRAPARRRAAGAPRCAIRRREHERADALRPAELVGGNSDEGQRRSPAGSNVDLAGGLHGVAMQQPAGSVDEVGGGAHGLDDAGLVIGGLEADEHAARPGSHNPSSRPRRATRSTTPLASTGMRSTRSAGKRAPSSTQGCSMALASSRSSGRLSARHARPGVRARTFASVPPLVNTTLRASAPTSTATASRARSTRPRAARPSACTEDGLPPASSARDHGVARLGPKRRSRVVVEIGARLSAGMRSWVRLVAVKRRLALAEPKAQQMLAFDPGACAKSGASQRHWPPRHKRERRDRLLELF